MVNLDAETADRNYKYLSILFKFFLNNVNDFRSLR